MSDVADAAASVDASPKRTVVVGHDGSADAAAALLTALELASQLQAPLVIARAWTISTAPRPADWQFGYVSTSDELEQAVYDDLVADARDSVERFPDVPVSYHTKQGSAAGSLIELSKTAQIVVVGSRGRGGFAEMVLGSVSDQVVRHAHCSVLVTKGQVRV
ncbi:MAG TPA: universal stress protein [Propionibacteriaceae bacterium]|nr:universal stress protein [Propionibacteriaceae bacterium]